jgi:hypothetical protein
MAHRILTSLVGIDATFSSTLSLTSLAGVGNRMLIVNSAGTVSTQAIPTGTVTSVGLSMPSAFTVTNSPVTGAGTLTVTGAGTTAQYIRGDGTLANFPTSTGGGSSFNYYLNGSISQGTFGGDTYYQMSRTPILGAGTNFTRTNGQGDGYIASFITDAGDPSLLNIPGGNWNLEFYFQSSATGGSPQFYGEIYKVSAANVFTLVASGSSNPEGITNGTIVDQYFTSIPVPQTSLLITDRIAIRIYVITSGRTITLHTENGNLCEVLTTFSTGLTALNGLTAQVQYLAVGTSGTDFNILSVTDTHTFNLPTASATNRGALSSTDWTTFNNKQNALVNPITGTGAAGQVAYWTGSTTQTGSNELFFDTTNNRLGVGTTTPNKKLEVYKSGLTDGTSDGIRISVQHLSANAQAALEFYHTYGSTALSKIATDIGAGGLSPSMYFIHNSITAIKIANTGNVLINTTTDAGYKLDVNGTARVVTSLRVGADGNTYTSIDNGSFNISRISDGGNGIVSIQGPTVLNANRSIGRFNGREGVQLSYDTASRLQVFQTTTTIGLGANDTSLTNDTSTILRLDGSKTASSAIARGANFVPTLVAAANNDVLVGLDISPTFTAGAFTGVTTLGLRVQSGVSSFGGNVIMNGNNFYLGGNFGNTVIRTISTTNVQIFNNNSGATLFLDANGSVQIGQSSATNWALFSASGHTIYNSTNTYFFSTGNVGINQGTDAGYKLDVNGTARVVNTLTVNGTGTNIAIQFSGGRIDADGTYLRIKSSGNLDMINIANNFVGINATSATASAVFQIDSTARGFLPPRMTATQRGAIATPATGLIVYQTDSVEGIYVYTSTGWKALTMT